MMFTAYRYCGTRSRYLSAIVAAIGLCAAGLNHAEAQSSATWTGGAGNGTWSNSSNWSSIPTTSGSWNLLFGGTTQTTNVNNIGTINVSSLSFTNDGSAGKTSIFQLSGSSLALTNSTIATTATTGASSLNTAGDRIYNALTLSGSVRILPGLGHNLTVAGTVGGSGALLVGGTNSTGTVYLTASNSYSGGSTVTRGLLQNGLSSDATGFSNTAFGTGGIVVSGSGTVSVRNGSTVVNNLTIGGAGEYANSSFQGAVRGSFGSSNQTATLTGTMTLAANATIKTAAVASGTNDRFVIAGPVNLGSRVLTLSPALAYGSSSTANDVPIDITGVIAGTGSVVIDGGQFTHVLLSGSNTYSGGTQVNAGSLRVGSSYAVGTGSLAVNDELDLNGQSLYVGALSGSASGVIQSGVAGAASLLTNSAANSKYYGTITDGSGTVQLTKTGTGFLCLTGSNSYTGGTTVNAGLIQNGVSTDLTGYSNTAFGTGDVVVSGSGTVSVRNNSTVANNISISGSGSGGDQGAIRGSFGSSSQTATLTGTVTLTGNATIKSAALDSAVGSKFVLAGPINLGANVLTLSSRIANNSRSLLNDVPIEVRGNIAGTGSVVIAADPQARVLLSGSSSYSGGTQVNAGTLRVGSSYAVGTGALQVNNGGILDVNGQSLHASSLDLKVGSTTLMDISGTAAGTYAQVVQAATVAFGGALNIDFKQSGFVVDDFWQLFGGSAYSGHFSSVTASGLYGDLTFTDLGNGEWKATGGLLSAGQSLSFYENNDQAFNGLFAAGQLVLVPEPSAVMIAGIGVFLAGCSVLRRRRVA